MQTILFWLKKIAWLLLSPLAACLIGIIAGAWPCRSSQSGAWRRTLLFLCVSALILSSNHFVSVAMLAPLENRYPPIPEVKTMAPLPPTLVNCGYVVVLAGGREHRPGFSPNNLLGAPALARVVEAIRLARAMESALLVICGPSESSVQTVVQYAVESGIPAERIRPLVGARDTEEEARSVTSFTQKGSIALVTSAWHLPRAAALFRHVGSHVVPCPADYIVDPRVPFHPEHFAWTADALSATTLALRERIGYLWAWLRGKTAD